MKTIDLSWRQIEKLVSVLVRKIHKKYDVIISINRGGLILGTLLSHATKTRHGVTSIESYQGRKKSKSHKIGHHISMIGALSPKTRVLLVDDISDSGESLREIFKTFEKLGCPSKNIDTATLHYKTRSCFEPTYYAKRINDYDWVNYPWERFKGND